MYSKGICPASEAAGYISVNTVNAQVGKGRKEKKKKKKKKDKGKHAKERAPTRDKPLLRLAGVLEACKAKQARSLASAEGKTRKKSARP
jgi:hypothetical protein